MPEITTACFHELHAGKLTTSITGKYCSVLIHLDTEFENFLFVVTKKADKVSDLTIAFFQRSRAGMCNLYCRQQSFLIGHF